MTLTNADKVTLTEPLTVIDELTKVIPHLIMKDGLPYHIDFDGDMVQLEIKYKGYTFRKIFGAFEFRKFEHMKMCVDEWILRVISQIIDIYLERR